MSNWIELLRRGTRGSGSGVKPLGAGASADNPASDISSFGRLSTFTFVDALQGERDDTNLEPGYDVDATLAMIGLDYRFNDNFFAGTNISFGNIEADYKNNLGSTENDSVIVGFHTTSYLKNFFIDTLITAGRVDISVNRFDGIANYTGDSEGKQYSADISSGYTYEKDAWRVIPSSQLFYLRGDIDDYMEQSNDPTNALLQSVNDQKYESLMLGLGVQTDYVLKTNWGVLIPSVKIKYQREFKDNDDTISGTFISGNSSKGTFTEEVDSRDKSSFTLGVGASAQFKHGFSGFINTEILYGDNNFDSTRFALGIRYEF